MTADDLTNVWQTFSTTSNWAVEIPCFTSTAGSGFPQGQCYSTTSAGDLTGVACPTGFCHLGGAPISNRNAFGADLAYVADP